ncbi:gamma-glutamylcyclotransferase family protein [Mesonia aestuariivivens]|uniref:Gamma-glutamylcyclotransferase n=1 Tax=Mesonia aestuariivivens TaxID=2796128 RepID=A0ABS6VYA1_9FLAO|nr:gamma-glutamylcyclotransferase family protein [Mesonia aestuariivivens]MBW2960582.1 gamma-glutamylcyclotransferase [Mesonia aestuariivivens]
MPHLFSYGTLQKEKVQLETFSRILEGKKDVLKCYQLKMVEITDPEVLRKSEEKFHPIIQYSGNETDKIEGTLFKITPTELQHADDYEVDDYKRIKVTFESGNTGYIYVKR